MAHARRRRRGTGDGRGAGSAVPDLGAVHSVSVDIILGLAEIHKIANVSHKILFNSGF